MLVKTLKRAAGAVSFEPNRIIDLPDELVSGFVEAGAVEVVECKVKSVAVQSEENPQTTVEEPEAEQVSEKPKRKRR